MAYTNSYSNSVGKKSTNNQRETRKMHKRLWQLTKTPQYKRNAANGLVTEWMYKLEDDGDWFSEPRRAGIGWGRIAINDGEAVATERPAVPYRYSTGGWERSASRIRSGRNGEVLIQTALQLAGVRAELLPMILDGDTSNPHVDILIESPTLNQYGSFSKLGYDVKTHRSLKFTNCPSTFPKTLRIDSTGAHQRKIDASIQREYPYRGTIHLSLAGGGMLIIPNSGSKNWLTQPNRFYGDGNNEPYQYAAPRSCMYPLAKLVKHYTNNTPALRSLNKNVPCPLLAHELRTTRENLTQETGKQHWQNAVKMMSQNQLLCYIDALALDAYNAPLETKLAFLESL